MKEQSYYKVLLCFTILAAQLLFIPVSSFTSISWATVEYTCQTEESCSFCHVDPDGGGELTLTGEDFMDAGYTLEKETTPSNWKRVFRLLLGFIHILSAVVWFGAIFYIHLFVKPSSLSSGLPKKERILGWMCIIVVGITGIILTTYRLRSIDEIWSTTFGIIWIIKVSLFMIMVIIAAIATTRINRELRRQHEEGQGDGLSSFNGKDGRPGRIAAEGYVYDVTGSKFWKEGVHMGRHYAGNDLTSSVADAPHGMEVFERVPKIGSVDTEKGIKKGPAMRIFIFMAYFILLCMIGVLFCLAYWNWGPSFIT